MGPQTSRELEGAEVGLSICVLYPGAAIHKRIQRAGGPGPHSPQDFLKMMQFAGNFKEKLPILSKFWAQAPLWGQNFTGPPDQNPGSAPAIIPLNIFKGRIGRKGLLFCRRVTCLGGSSEHVQALRGHPRRGDKLSECFQAKTCNVGVSQCALANSEKMAGAASHQLRVLMLLQVFLTPRSPCCGRVSAWAFKVKNDLDLFLDVTYLQGYEMQTNPLPMSMESC